MRSYQKIETSEVATASDVVFIYQHVIIFARASMPTMLIIGPYRFFFVSLDYGEPPHVHVQREKMVAKFWLDPVALERAGGFKPQELNKLFKLTQEHHDLLLEQWHEHFGN